MKTIPIQELSPAAFRKFGDYVPLLDDSFYRTQAGAGRTNEFYPDQMPLLFGGDTVPSVSVTCVSRDEMLVSFLEYHSHTCEGVLPIDADCVVYLAPPMRRDFDPDTLEAFRVPKGTFLRLNPGVVHGRQFTSDTDLVHVLIMLPTRTYANDCVAWHLPEDERVLIEG